jgi:succinyl-CoA synthetase alpha subunit
MAILVQEMCGVLIQGITGVVGSSFAERMALDGTPLVGGVTPGRRDGHVAGVPVFPSVERAVLATGATASLVVVPAAAVADAITEAAMAGIKLISVYSEHVPVHDAISAITTARALGATLIGPNAAGIASPGIANMSDILSSGLTPGPVGLVSKSGTLTYEVIAQLRELGLGISTVACLGGDAIVGCSYTDLLPAFAADSQTQAVVLLGEIGGTAEHQAAEVWQRLGSPKPLIAYVAGSAAPANKRMGHAGAIATTDAERVDAKNQALTGARADVVEILSAVAPAAVAALARMDGAIAGISGATAPVTPGGSNL